VALKEQIQNDLKAALLGGDRFVGEVLRGLKAAILNEEVAKNVRETGLDDASIEQVVAKEVKKRVESATLYTQNGRQELADNENREAVVLQKYLPAQISDDELQQIIAAKITEIGVTDAKGMGQVIGAVKAQVGNTADGASIARFVKEALSA
jgi:uncharacterized protein